MSAIAVYSDTKITVIDPSKNPVIDLQLSNLKRTNIFIYVTQYSPQPNAIFNFYDNSGIPISPPLSITQPCLISFTNSRISKFSVNDNLSYSIIVAYTIITYYDESVINQIPTDFTIIPLTISNLVTPGYTYAEDLSITTTPTQLVPSGELVPFIDIMADPTNTDIVFVGSSGAQTFPLRAGASLTIYNTRLGTVYAKANSGTQLIHILYVA